MFSKKYFLALAILLVSGMVALAQSAPVRGKVELKKDDGTVVPVAGALVEVYRTDIKAKSSPAKTGKKGDFVFAGLPLGTYAFAVSGAGIKADMLSGVKAGSEDVNFLVSAGDGVALTEDQVRNALTTKPKKSSESSSAGASPEDQKKAKEAKEAYDKQVAEVTNKNKKIEESTKIVNASLEEGKKAFEAKNWDLAITKFQEGINADPDFEGSATVLNNNKAMALRLRGVESANKGVTDQPNKASWVAKAKDDFNESENASRRTLELVAKIADPLEAKKYDPVKLTALSNLVEVHRLMVVTRVDSSQATDAIAILDQYLQLEPDPAEKLKNQIKVGDALRLSGNTAAAIPIYRKVLDTTPEDYDVIGSLGLCLFSEGAGNNNKEQMQEGLNYMQKFSDGAPDKPGNAAYAELKQSIKDAVIYLKEQKLTPQKLPKATTTAPKKKP